MEWMKIKCYYWFNTWNIDGIFHKFQVCKRAEMALNTVRVFGACFWLLMVYLFGACVTFGSALRTVWLFMCHPLFGRSLVFFRRLPCATQVFFAHLPCKSIICTTMVETNTDGVILSSIRRSALSCAILIPLLPARLPASNFICRWKLFVWCVKQPSAKYICSNKLYQTHKNTHVNIN